MTPKHPPPAGSALHLATNRNAFGSAAEIASRRLGGVTVWAPTPEDLEVGLRTVSTAIMDCARVHLSITKSVLRKLVREHLKESTVEDRLFSAVLGYSMRIGGLDSFVASSANDRPFRVLIHRSQKERFDEALRVARRLLLQQSTISVPILEKALFGNRAYNTWSSTSHVLGRLSYLGFSTLDDEGACRLVPGLR